MENEIQAQMSAVGLIVASILQDVYKSTTIVFSIVKKHSKELDEWKGSLPFMMQLSSLTAQDSGHRYQEKHRRSLILVHVMQIGAQILLQRRLLVAMAECRINNRWTLDGSPEEGARIQNECVKAARTCVELLDVLGYTKNMFRRCWLCM